ncbi:hypothetical protein QQ045_020713 [Rhodiola kirilowii]
MDSDGVAALLCRMSDVFEGYERQYCELSVNLSGKCSAVSHLDGGASSSWSFNGLVCVSFFVAKFVLLSY